MEPRKIPEEIITISRTVDGCVLTAAVMPHEGNRKKDFKRI
jgi:hypothetical protein